MNKSLKGSASTPETGEGKRGFLLTQNAEKKSDQATLTNNHWDKKVEEFAKCRAYVLKAIHAKPGMTYHEIRMWIHEHYRFWMEGVGPRCRELYGLGYANRETDKKGRVHVYPVDEV